MGKQRKTIRNKRKIAVDYSNQQNNNNNQELNQTITKAITRETKLTIISIFVVTIVMISSAYAIFSSVQKSKDYNTLTVGVLKVDFNKNGDDLGNVIKLNGAYPVSDSEGLKTSPYSFTITNSGTLNAKYRIKIIDDNDMIDSDDCSDKLLDKKYIKVSVNDEKPFLLNTTETNNYIISDGDINVSESKTFNIKIWIDENATNDVLGKHYHGKIVVETQNMNTNKGIKEAYSYDKSGCVTGEEETCVKTTCYESSNKGACQAGTIIKYAVNNSEEKYFYVLHDDGKTMTLQQRENTVYNTAWYIDSEDNSKGPLSILPVLEEATKSWNNVNSQTYTMGTTNFNNTNTYTGCMVSAENKVTCNANTYTLTERISKARMITIQEANDVGCTTLEKSCPIWMYNYLQSATSYNGTMDDQTGNENIGYWTLSAFSSGNNSVWTINNKGSIQNDASTSSKIFGARAVININK